MLIQQNLTYYQMGHARNVFKDNTRKEKNALNAQLVEPTLLNYKDVLAMRRRACIGIIKFVSNVNILNIGTMDIWSAKTAQYSKSTTSTKINVITVQHLTLISTVNIAQYVQIIRCTIDKPILAKIVPSTRSMIMLI